MQGRESEKKKKKKKKKTDIYDWNIRGLFKKVQLDVFLFNKDPLIVTKSV